MLSDFFFGLAGHSGLFIYVLRVTTAMGSKMEPLVLSLNLDPHQGSGFGCLAA
jgi:hypothetical protein